jgi:hypothetical protein
MSLPALSKYLMLSDAFSVDFDKERPICERLALLQLIPVVRHACFDASMIPFK